MLNVTDATKTAYNTDSLNKTLTISFPNKNVTYTNNDIVSESLQLNEAINTDENLTFKGCIASQLKFKCSSPMLDLRNEYVEVTIKAGTTETIPLFKGYVNTQTNLTHEDVNTEITAYDVLYKVKDIDVYDWYEALTFPLTLKSFRTALFTHLQITQESIDLPNDSLQLSKSIRTNNINALDLLQWICQVNGRFGQIDRTEKFRYIKLSQITEALYPRNDLYPADDLYPSEESAHVTILQSQYRSCEHEPYKVAGLTSIKIFDAENQATSYGDSESNVFCVSDNPVAYGLPMAQAARNLYSAIRGTTYDPVNLECRGLPYIECGDILTVQTRLNIVTTYVLQRTLKGIQALFDEFVGQGEELQPQFKENAETTKLAQERYDRTISENGITTAFQVADQQIQAQVNSVDGRVSSLTVTVDGINTRVSNAEGNINQLDIDVTGLHSAIYDSQGHNKIDVTAQGLNAEITRATNAEGTLNTSIQTNANGISTLVQKTGINNLGQDETLYTKINVTANGLSGEITRATNAEGTLSNRISATAESFEMVIDNSHAGRASVGMKVTTEGGSSFNVQAKDITFNGMVAFTNLYDGNTRIDGSNIKTGYISADRIQVHSLNANKITGSIQDSGRTWTLDFEHGTFTIGNISADKINTGTLNANNVSITNLSANSITSGALTITSGSNTLFKADKSNSTVKIAGFDVSANEISSSNGVVSLKSNATGTNTAFSLGTKFKVDGNGSLTASGATITGDITATSGKIGGFTITSSQIKNASGSFFLDSSASGNSYAFKLTNNFTITANGAIEATSGKIGSFNIQNGCLVTESSGRFIQAPYGYFQNIEWLSWPNNTGSTINMGSAMFRWLGCWADGASSTRRVIHWKLKSNVSNSDYVLCGS